MAHTVKVWFDAEGDYLEVLFSDQPPATCGRRITTPSWNGWTNPVIFSDFRS